MRMRSCLTRTSLQLIVGEISINRRAMFHTIRCTWLIVHRYRHKRHEEGKAKTGKEVSSESKGYFLVSAKGSN